jgi:hypothetical protein
MTFSAFEPWESRTAEEHAERIAGILDDWGGAPRRRLLGRIRSFPARR